MNEELFVGLGASFVTLLGVGYLMLKKNAGIFRMYAAMILIGLGYLTMTGAINEIGAKILGRKAIAPIEAAPVVEKTAEPTPAAEKKSEPEPPAAPATAAPAAAPEKDAPPVEDMPPPAAPPASGAAAPANP